MSANTVPIFLIKPRLESCRISAANVNRDGSGTLVPLWTAGANGSRIDYVIFTNASPGIGSAVAKVWRIFISDTSGLNPRLINEQSIAAATSSATVQGQTSTVTMTNGRFLQPGQILYVTQSVYSTTADQTDVFAQGGDY